MANKYVDLAILNLGLKKMAESVASNFSFKKDTIKKIEIGDAVPTGASAGATPEKCLIITYNDNGLLDKNGSTINHVINLSIAELGTSISEWVSGTDYKVGDMVINDLKLYRNITSPQADNTTFDKTEWELIGSDFKIEEFVPSTDYETGAIITHNQHIYKCVTSPQADNTTFDVTEWKLLGIDDREKSLLDSLKVEELHDNLVNPSEVTGYKILFKDVDKTDGRVGVISELAQVKDLPKLMINDTISKTDATAEKMTLSAKYILEAIETLSGADMSSFAKKVDIFYHHTTYTQVSDGSVDGAKEVVAVVSDTSSEVSYDDVVLQIPTINTGDFVTEGIGYDAPLYLEKESSLYKEVLSKFSIETLKEDISDPDLITGYILKYRGKKILTEADVEDSIIDFDTLIQ